MVAAGEAYDARTKLQRSKSGELQLDAINLAAATTGLLLLRAVATCTKSKYLIFLAAVTCNGMLNMSDHFSGSALGYDAV